MPKKEILSIGGQAVIEGVMMRSKDKVAVAVRNPKGKIKFLQIPIKYGKIKSKIVKIPIIRGIIMMWETLSIGFRALKFSANVATGEEEEIGLIGMATLILVSVIFGLGIFLLAPLFLLRIIIFSVINHPSFIVKFLQRVILIPLIAGIAYELLKFGGKYHKNPIVKLFVLPGLGLQLITTREPDKKQIEVAIAALKNAL